MITLRRRYLSQRNVPLACRLTAFRERATPESFNAEEWDDDHRKTWWSSASRFRDALLWRLQAGWRRRGGTARRRSKPESGGGRAARTGLRADARGESAES